MNNANRATMPAFSDNGSFSDTDLVSGSTSPNGQSREISPGAIDRIPVFDIPDILRNNIGQAHRMGDVATVNSSAGVPPGVLSPATARLTQLLTKIHGLGSETLYRFIARIYGFHGSLHSILHGALDPTFLDDFITEGLVRTLGLVDEIVADNEVMRKYRGMGLHPKGTLELAFYLEDTTFVQKVYVVLGSESGFDNKFDILVREI